MPNAIVTGGNSGIGRATAVAAPRRDRSICTTASPGPAS